MLTSLFTTPTHTDHLFSSNDNGAGGGTDGGAGSGGGGGGAPANDNTGNEGGQGGSGGGGEKTLTQTEVNRIVETRVGETKRQTEEAVAKQLGVDLEEAQRLIKAAKATEDSQKTEAQLAREKADKEAQDAAAAKSASDREKHDAAVERVLVRAIKVPDDVKDEDADEWLDRKVARISRVVDVEVGADAAAIKAAVDALRKDEPLLFGGEATSPGKPSGGSGGPSGDPKGTPPKRTSTESGYDKGAERAKALAGAETYPILEANKT